MKKILQTMRIHSLIILISLGCITAYGQFIPMNTTIHTPQGNVPYTYYSTVPHYYAYGGAPITTGMKYRFTIVLKNDSTFSARTKIDFADRKENFIVIKKRGDQKILRPSDTKSISRVTNEGKLLVGIPTDSCWLFKTFPGKINGYSSLAESGLMNVIAIQARKDGPILPLTKENLVPMIGTDDPHINDLIKDGNLIKAIWIYDNKNKNKSTSKERITNDQ